MLWSKVRKRLKTQDAFFSLLTAAPAAHGSSQARGPIRAASGAYAAAAAMPDLGRICDLCHGLWQHQILDPLSEARD